MATAGDQPDAGVERRHPVRPGQYRIEVRLGELRQVGGHPGEPQQQFVQLLQAYWAAAPVAHIKWLKVSRSLPWRRPIPSLNCLITSHVWRQDHNGFSHQDPGFVDHILNKSPDVVRVYLPPDANSLLGAMWLDPVPLPELSGFGFSVRFGGYWGVRVRIRAGHLEVGLPATAPTALRVQLPDRTVTVAPGEQCHLRLPAV